MSLLTGKVPKPSAKVVPRSKKELQQIIDERIEEIKPRPGQEVDLNWIDISRVDDLSYLFANVDYIPVVNMWLEEDKSNVKKNMRCMFAHSKFNGDLSGRDVSNVKDMSGMFAGSNFNGDISGWNVSHVKDMSGMFAGSYFNGDLSGWNVTNVEDMSGMFAHSNFNGDLSGWDVSNVKDMSGMFERCPFDGKNGDISNWKVSKGTNMRWMFADCPLENNPPKWYKDK